MRVAFKLVIGPFKCILWGFLLCASCVKPLSLLERLALILEF